MEAQHFNDHNTGYDLRKIWTYTDANTRSFGQSFASPIQHLIPRNSSVNTIYRLLLNFLSCCSWNKRRMGVDLNTNRLIMNPKKLDRKEYRVRNEIIDDIYETNSLGEDKYDFGCQYSLYSNQSLEIKSHSMSRSVSNLSSFKNFISSNWHRRFQKQKKERSSIQAMIMTLSRKIKPKFSKTPRSKKNNVVVLHIPEKFSNTSTTGTSSPAPQPQPKYDKPDRPLIIKDEPFHRPVDLSTPSKMGKMCRPGEVYL